MNPARSTGPALMVGGWAISQLWLFWIAPIIGAVVAGVVYSWLGGEREETAPLKRAHEEVREPVGRV